MTLENIILTGFVCAAIACGYLLFLFFKPRGDRTPPPLTWRRWTAGNALIILFLAALVLAAGEIYYRFFYDATDSYMMSKTSLRWEQRHYQLNASGFRDSIEYKWKIPAGKRRITFLGDSFTAGHGIKDVEQRFANRIRARNPGWEVHVMAKNGWETGTHLEVLEDGLPPDYDCDLVVLVYCLNDISDLAPDYWINIVERITQTWRPGPIVLESFFLDTYYHRIRMALDPDLRDYYGYVGQWYRGPVWNIQEARLRQLRDKVAQRGGQLRVVTFPFLQSAGHNYPFREIHMQLDVLWTSMGVPHLDLLDTFSQVDSPQLVVNRFDAHPNEKAHEMAANAIERFIQGHLSDR